MVGEKLRPFFDFMDKKIQVPKIQNPAVLKRVARFGRQKALEGVINVQKDAVNSGELGEGLRRLTVDGVEMLAYDVGVHGEVPEVFRDKRREREVDLSSLRSMLGELSWEDFQKLGRERE